MSRFKSQFKSQFETRLGRVFRSARRAASGIAMRAASRAATVALTAGFAAALTGCPPPKAPDVNAERFERADEASERREGEQVAQWERMVMNWLRRDRPDVTAEKTEGFAVALEADGARGLVDFAPLKAGLLANPDQALVTLRDHLARNLAGFDQHRLKTLGFDKVRPRLTPHLASALDLKLMAAPLGADVALESAAVAGDLSWTPVVRWERGEVVTPIGPAVLEAWGASPEAVRKAALENLRGQLARAKESAFVTSSLGTARTGRLGGDANAAVIVLPEFLALVRKAWGSEADLVIFPYSRQTVQFIEAGNERLVGMMYPNWQKAVASAEDPLTRQALLLGDKGLAPFAPKAATKPVETQPATKPRPYVAH